MALYVEFFFFFSSFPSDVRNITTLNFPSCNNNLFVRRICFFAKVVGRIFDWKKKKQIKSLFAKTELNIYNNDKYEKYKIGLTTQFVIIM